MRDKPVKFFNNNEMKELLASVESRRDLAMFTCMFAYALRAGEVALIKMSDISFEDNKIHITRLKGSISHTAPLLPAPRQALKAWIRDRGKKPGAVFLSRNHRPISRYQIDELLKKYCANAGIDRSKAHCHALKHAAGTALANKLDVQLCQMWMGHKDIKSTMKYVHLSGVHLNKIAETLQDFGRR